MTESIHVVVVEPNIRPYAIEIDNDINAMKTIVGTDIEIVKWKHLFILYDKEAQMKDSEFNRKVGELDLFGTFIICNMEGDKFTDVQDKYVLLIAYGRMLTEE